MRLLAWPSLPAGSRRYAAHDRGSAQKRNAVAPASLPANWLSLIQLSFIASPLSLYRFHQARGKFGARSGLIRITAIRQCHTHAPALERDRLSEQTDVALRHA